MDVHITRLSLTYPAGVFLQWDVNPDNGVSGTYLFNVERSGSPEGPWRLVAGPLANTINYTEDYSLYDDTNPYDDTVSDQANLKSFQTEIYYRITATAPNGVTATSPVVDIDGIAVPSVNAPSSAVGYTIDDSRRYYTNLDPYTNRQKTIRYPHKRIILLRRKILREQYVTLKKLNGVAVKVLKRKHFGVRCSDCSDELTRAIVQYTCTTCYGTGWEGGFFSPIDTYINFRPETVNKSTSQVGVTEVVKTSATMLYYPKVEKDDVIVELDTNKRWRVETSSQTELRRMILHQRVVISELSRDSVEYLVDIA